MPRTSQKLPLLAMLTLYGPSRGPRRAGERLRKRRFRKLVANLSAQWSSDERTRFPGTDKHGALDVAFAGRAGYVEAPPQIQGTAHSIAGLYPFITSGPRPVLGAPLGRHLIHRYGIFLDLMSMHLSRGGSTPSMMVFGLPGRGKSSVFFRMALGMIASGFLMVFPGDLKGEYSAFIREIGGFVYELGAGKEDAVNPMDPGPMASLIDEIEDPKIRDELHAQINTRRQLTCASLVELVLDRGLDLENGEKLAFQAAVDAAVELKGSQALLADVAAILAEGAPQIRRAAMLEDPDDYAAATKALGYALHDLVHGAEFGGAFNRQTSRQMPVGAHVAFDISGVPLAQKKFRTALQVVTWSYASAVTTAVGSLVKLGLWPETHYVSAYDELWQALQVNPRITVFILEELVRLNRESGNGWAMITHGTGDLTLPDADLTDRARKFIARASIRIYAGTDPDEIAMLDGVQRFTPMEKAWLSAWAAEGEYGGVPPGRGKFLVKFGDDPGIPVDMGEKRPFERRLHDTDKALAGARAAFNNTNNS